MVIFIVSITLLSTFAVGVVVGVALAGVADGKYLKRGE